MEWNPSTDRMLLIMAKKEETVSNVTEETVSDAVEQPFSEQITLEEYPVAYQQAVIDAQDRLDLMHIVAKELSEKGFSNEAVQLLTGIIL